MNEIDGRWKKYRFGVIPLDAPELQAIECRRAYYAGAQAIVDMALHLAAGDAKSAARQMGEFKKEIERFRADVQAGRA
jgi:hypothetical protein